jgi:hypothetical protein
MVHAGKVEVGKSEKEVHRHRRRVMTVVISPHPLHTPLELHKERVDPPNPGTAAHYKRESKKKRKEKKRDEIKKLHEELDDFLRVAGRRQR